MDFERDNWDNENTDKSADHSKESQNRQEFSFGLEERGENPGAEEKGASQQPDPAVLPADTGMEAAARREDMSMQERVQRAEPGQEESAPGTDRGSFSYNAQGTGQSVNSGFSYSARDSFQRADSCQRSGHNTPRPGFQPVQGVPVKQEKKKGRGGKIAGLVASAALFGLVAGGTRVGVNRRANGGRGSAQVETQESQTQTVISGNKTEASAEATAAPVTETSGMDVSGIAAGAMPSVVSISGNTRVKTENFFGQSQSYDAPSSGSGIIIGETEEELLVVTNNHVVEDTTELQVEFIDGSKANASVKGGDSDKDVAVIAVKLSDLSQETLDQIAVAKIGDSDSLKVGQGVVAIGNALGYGQSVTVGYISALNREVQTKDGSTRNLLQTDAAINPGNSGGALLNMQGEVIGINSAKYSSTEVEGMGYAIPISTVKDLIGDLSMKQTRTRVADGQQGYLGIQGKDIDADTAEAYDMPQGIYVYKVLEGGAAAASDLQERDIIVKFDGQSIKTLEELQERLNYYPGGTTVDVTVQRLEGSEYQEHTLSITLGTRPASPVQS